MTNIDILTVDIQGVKANTSLDYVITQLSNMKQDFPKDYEAFAQMLQSQSYINSFKKANNLGGK